MQTQKIRYRETIYRFTDDICIDIHDMHDGGWVAECKEFDTSGWGLTPEFALRDFYENFDYVYKDIAIEADCYLTPKAQEMKEAILQKTLTPEFSLWGYLISHLGYY